MIDGKINVLFAASECAPLCKTGGLADVVSALPKALSKTSVKSSIILPYYSTLAENIRSKAELVAEFTIKLGWKEKYVGLLKLKFKNRIFYFIDNEEYYKRDKLYGYYEDSERYIFFSLAIVKALEYIKDIDVIHCNDWQTSLIPFILKKLKGNFDIKTVLTIHNLRFQGNMNLDDFKALLSLSGKEEWFSELAHNDQANILKAGLYNADLVTTVSENYANEIKYAYYGETLEGCINDIDYKLKGIVNGIDVISFNPEKDSKIYETFNDFKGKKKNKKLFHKEYCLDLNDDMVIGIVTRLDRQKGLDLILYAIEKILEKPIKFILLGTGDKEYERAFLELEEQHKDKVRCFIKYDDIIARKIYASCDVFLMPSMFEPCGLGQMIAMRYGTLPIVRETGGLADTVIPYNEVTGEGTGFSFSNYNGDELLNTVLYAQSIYDNNSKAFNKMIKTAMESDFSWSKSAKEYKKIYQKIMSV